MNAGKRIVTVFALAALVLTSFPAALATQNAREAEGFQYFLLPDGTAEIAAYLGTEDVCVIPETLDGYPVTSLGMRIQLSRKEYDAEYDVYRFFTPSVLEIPASVTHIGMLDDEAINAIYDTLTPVTVWRGEWRVAAGNPMYRDIDGVLFDAAGKTLMMYPAGREEETYAVPEGTVEIRRGAFSARNSLRKLILPDSLERIGDFAFAGCEEMEEITIPERVDFIGWLAFPGMCGSYGNISFKQIKVSPYNGTYFSVDGVLFSPADRRLICYPAGKQETGYDVPEGIQVIGARAFYWNKALNVLTIPEGVTDIEELALAVRPDENGIRISFPRSLENIHNRQMHRDYQGRYTYVVWPGSTMDQYIQAGVVFAFRVEYAGEE